MPEKLTHALVWMALEPGEWVTRAEIADRVGRSKTTYVNAIIEGAVERGWLEKRVGENYQNIPSWLYRRVESEA